MLLAKGRKIRNGIPLCQDNLENRRAREEWVQMSKCNWKPKGGLRWWGWAVPRNNDYIEEPRRRSRAKGKQRARGGHVVPAHLRRRRPEDIEWTDRQTPWLSIVAPGPPRRLHDQHMLQNDLFPLSFSYGIPYDDPLAIRQLVKGTIDGRLYDGSLPTIDGRGISRWSLRVIRYSVIFKYAWTRGAQEQ